MSSTFSFLLVVLTVLVHCGCCSANAKISLSSCLSIGGRATEKMLAYLRDDPAYNRSCAAGNTDICSSNQPLTSLQRDVAIGYQFWIRQPETNNSLPSAALIAYTPKGQHIFNAFYCISEMYMEIEVGRGRGECPRCHGNRTREFCGLLASVYWLTVEVGAIGATHGHRLADPMLLKNYLYYSIAYATDISSAFKLKTQRGGGVNMTPDVKFWGFLLLPLLFPTFLLNVRVLYLMARDSGHSEFVYQLALTILDAGLYMALTGAGFPFGFMYAWGSPCEAIDALLLSMWSPKNARYIDIVHRTAQSISYSKNFILTMLMMDRTMAFCYPSLFERFCNVRHALRYIVFTIFINAFLTALLFFNTVYLDLEQPILFVLFCFARTVLAGGMMLLVALQGALPLLVFYKLLLQFTTLRKYSFNAKYDVRQNIFLALFTSYNLICVWSLLGFMYGDTLWNFIMIGRCNRCLYKFLHLSNYTKLMIIILGVSLALNWIFDERYRDQLYQLLLLKKLLNSPLIRRIITSKPVQDWIKRNRRNSEDDNPNGKSVLANSHTNVDASEPEFELMNATPRLQSDYTDLRLAVAAMDVRHRCGQQREPPPPSVVGTSASLNRLTVVDFDSSPVDGGAVSPLNRRLHFGAGSGDWPLSPISKGALVSNSGGGSGGGGDRSGAGGDSLTVIPPSGWRSRCQSPTPESCLNRSAVDSRWTTANRLSSPSFSLVALNSRQSPSASVGSMRSTMATTQPESSSNRSVERSIDRGSSSATTISVGLSSAAMQKGMVMTRSMASDQPMEVRANSAMRKLSMRPQTANSGAGGSKVRFTDDDDTFIPVS